MASGLITAWQIEGEKLEVMTDFLFSGSKNSLRTVTAAMKSKTIASRQESNDKPRQRVGKQTLLC